MPLWESNEIYFLAGFTVLVTLGVFASVAYFVYKKVATNGRRADEEQAALEKVLLRKETITTSPPTKPLIVSPSFSSPNKVPARHLRSGSYSPTHYLSPYHIRQPRRNSSPTSNISSIQQPKLPQLQLQHPHPQEQNIQLPQDTDTTTTTTDASGAETASDVVPSTGNEVSHETSVPVIKTNSNNKQWQQSSQPNVNGGRNNVAGSLAHHNSQYYGTISPRRAVGRHTVAPAENNPLVSNTNNGTVNGVSAFLPLKCGIGTGPVIVSNLKSGGAFIKSEYVQLPGKDGVDFNEGWKNKDECSAANEKWKNCSDMDDGAALRKKLLLQKQYQHKLQLQQQQNRMSNEPPGELFKMKHTVSEEIPYYISTQ
ncbi:unnamed protein product [Orchesella dallaii]|uniref:Uncharacterized protein n=1 Tax=Orchesella dallaii TaxID=48710 RepID=A0ABP1QFV3_9HEXA